MNAAIAARGVRQALAEEGAGISIWSADADRNVSLTRVTTEHVSQRTAGLWTICWDHDVEAIVRAARSERLPRETGGVLVGAIDAQSHRIYVVDAILSPPDSVEWPSLYIRGAEGLDERVAAVGVSTAGMLQYVGEWHSHPDGCSAQASGTDQEALGRLSRQMAFEGLPALMLIVGQHDLQFFLASVV
jgi:integrative and conjugative element protein (TIGR02256 family)